MELIGAVFLVLALTVLVGLFVARPMLFGSAVEKGFETTGAQGEQDHQRSALLAERDRILLALQELDFDNALGKVPEEDYPVQRAGLLQAGAAILRQLDAVQPAEGENGKAVSAEDRIEAAVAARRADAAVGAVGVPTVAVMSSGGRPAKDAVEDRIAAHRRKREEKAAGFCPKCGRPVQKSDQFCSRCGASL